MSDDYRNYFTQKDRICQYLLVPLSGFLQPWGNFHIFPVSGLSEYRLAQIVSNNRDRIGTGRDFLTFSCEPSHSPSVHRRPWQLRRFSYPPLPNKTSNSCRQWLCDTPCPMGAEDDKLRWNKEIAPPAAPLLRRLPSAFPLLAENKDAAKDNYAKSQESFAAIEANGSFILSFAPSVDMV